MDQLQIVLGALLVLALLAWYLSFSASRLDRLHHRVEGAVAALDAQLVRRAEAAVELATSGAVDPASGLLLADAASIALEVGEQADHVGATQHAVAPRLAGGDLPGQDHVSRERAESDLSQALRATLDQDVVAQLSADPVLAPLVDRLAAACHRVRLARRFLNGAVTDAARVRGKRVVRWARLAGRAEVPQTFEMDDDPPPALVD
ncbi:hypothetical protein [Angustibacter sp. Root456]|uniref:hypothetical protein n=1 Tax=Angustibacter sp. Root456 TaxID=1736539 RepID=UPI0009E93B5A|nr:hypothetical protein [Angustibacter sp. Root456]